MRNGLKNKIKVDDKINGDILYNIKYCTYLMFGKNMKAYLCLSILSIILITTITKSKINNVYLIYFSISFYFILTMMIAYKYLTKGIKQKKKDIKIFVTIILFVYDISNIIIFILLGKNVFFMILFFISLLFSIYSVYLILINLRLPVFISFTLIVISYLMFKLIIDFIIGINIDNLKSIKNFFDILNVGKMINSNDKIPSYWSYMYEICNKILDVISAGFLLSAINNKKGEERLKLKVQIAIRIKWHSKQAIF